MNKKAFTLMEILVVIVIISILGIITVPNVLEYFHESKIKAMVVQESKLVESGDILVRDYCEKPLNEEYRLNCDKYYHSLENINDENIVDDDPLTYTRYICVSTLKDKDYYSEKLQFSGEECSGAVVYRIDENTNIQTESFAVIKCGTGYKTIFDGENTKDYEEFMKQKTRANELETVLEKCFTNQSQTQEEKEYQLTINFTEHNQYGQQIAETISEKVLKGNNIKKTVPPYHSKDGTNEEHYTPFVHSSSDNVLNNSGKKVKPTIVNNELNFIMPANNVTINIAYSINQYTVTFNHIDAVLGTSTIGGQNYNSDSYKLFNGESVNIPYKKIPNFKIVSHSNGTQIDYELNEHNNKTIDIKYQQINFNITYDSKGGSACPSQKTEYKKNFGTLCTPTKKGHTFEGWYLDGTKVTSETKNNNYHDITLDANWIPNTYVITYHLGNGSDTPGATVLGTTECIYGENCVLKKFSDFEKTFPYSTSDRNYGWKFDGWTNNEQTMEIKYENKHNFTYNKDYNLNLYAIGRRELQINGGIAPNEILYKLEQYWNPYSTDEKFLTNVTLPKSKDINGWIFMGYRAGSSLADGKLTFDATKQNKTFKVAYNVWPKIRSMYKRDFTLNYDANGGTTTASQQKIVQYYNSGYATLDDDKNKTNVGAKTSIVEFNIESSAKKTGNIFKGWLDNETEDVYSKGTVVTLQPNVNSTSSKTLKAQWETNTYYVAYNCNGGTGEMQNSTHEYDKSKALLENECVKPGYEFNKWIDANGTEYSNKEIVKNLTTVNNGTITLNAQWKRITYKITYDLNGGQWPNGFTPQTEISYASLLELQYPTREGYIFSKWSITGYDEETAKYGKETNNVTGSFGESPFKIKRPYFKNLTTTKNGEVKFKATWTSGDSTYIVKHWKQKVNGGTEKNSENYSLDLEETIEATTNSSVTPEVNSYTGFNSPSTQTITVKSDGSTTVNYYYTRKEYTLTLEKGDDEIASVSGAGTYRYGEVVSIYAVPETYHNFQKWTKSSSTTSISTSSTYSYTMPAANTTLKAYGTNAKIVQALYSKDDYSLRFVNSTTHYAKGDIFTYTNSSGEEKSYLIQAVYKSFIDDKYTTPDEVDWKNIAEYIKKVQVHNTIKPTSTAYWFANFINCKTFYLNALDTINTTNMRNMFHKAGSSVSLQGQTFKITGMDDLNTSKVTNMISMFNQTGIYASEWDVGNLRKKTITKDDGTTYTAWDTKNVKDMRWMFQRAATHAKTFNPGNISNWNVENVENMKAMFAYTGYYSTTWNIGTLAAWDTGNVKSMDQMFNNAGAQYDAIQNINLKDWDVTKVVDKNDYEHETQNEKTWPQYCYFENKMGQRDRSGIIQPSSFKISNYAENCYIADLDKHYEYVK